MYRPQAPKADPLTWSDKSTALYHLSGLACKPKTGTNLVKIPVVSAMMGYFSLCHCVEIGSGTLPAFSPMDVGDCYTGGKVAGA